MKKELKKLVLDITKTNEAKTYLNKVVAKGELYERVVFVLNGEKYKELDVVEGEKIDNVEVLSDSFSGWYTDENLTNKYNFKNEVNKDLILYGVTDIVKHKVTFIDDNPETKSKDLYDEQEVVDGKSPRKPSDPEHNGYEFKCWVKQNNECFDFDKEKITDEIELTSTYETIKYTIIYKGLTEEEKTELNNPAVYTVESEDFTLNNPDRNGYNFLGWTEKDSDDPTINKTIVKGTTGNKVITANFNTIEYTITYNLNGGSLEEGETNPNTYTVKTEDFTLNNPKKAGYTFVGWEGTGLGSATKNVTIRKGSTGNREYTAVYETKNYTITYKGLTDEEKASLNNPTEYTIESDDITITNPQDRYDNDGDLSEIFVGWEGTGIEGTTNNVVIAKGSKGNREYTAKFETASPDSYPITYNLNGGSLEEGKTNPTSYTKETEDFTLNNPSKKGYEFTGWEGTGLTVPSTNVTIVKGSRGERSYTANYSTIDYTITYDLDGGSLEEGKTNPETYTVETEDFTLNNPSKNGYTFVGWEGTGIEGTTTTVTITKGSTGNRSYKAKYVDNGYTITYDLNGGSLEEGKQIQTLILQRQKISH